MAAQILTKPFKLSQSDVCLHRKQTQIFKPLRVSTIIIPYLGLEVKDLRSKLQARILLKNNAKKRKERLPSLLASLVRGPKPDRPYPFRNKVSFARKSGKAH